MTEATYTLSVAQIFTLFFIMLGPLRLLVPFAKATHELSYSDRTAVATKACGISVVSIVAGSLIGKAIFYNWNLEIPVLSLATGIVFFLSGLVPLLNRKTEAVVIPKIIDPRSVAFKMMITPFGMGAAIVLLASSHSFERTMMIMMCILAIILLDLIIMMFGGSVLKKGSVIGMQVLSVSMGILGVALGLEIIVHSIRMLKG